MRNEALPTLRETRKGEKMIIEIGDNLCTILCLGGLYAAISVVAIAIALHKKWEK